MNIDPKHTEFAQESAAKQTVYAAKRRVRLVQTAKLEVARLEREKLLPPKPEPAGE